MPPGGAAAASRRNGWRTTHFCACARRSCTEAVIAATNGGVDLRQLLIRGNERCSQTSCRTARSYACARPPCTKLKSAALGGSTGGSIHAWQAAVAYRWCTAHTMVCMLLHMSLNALEAPLELHIAHQVHSCPCALTSVGLQEGQLLLLSHIQHVPAQQCTPVYLVNVMLRSGIEGPLKLRIQAIITVCGFAPACCSALSRKALHDMA